jgi:hypothetical protein
VLLVVSCVCLAISLAGCDRTTMGTNQSDLISRESLDIIPDFAKDRTWNHKPQGGNDEKSSPAPEGRSNGC